ncbi:MAG: DUF4230 domain-containing protein [Olegusella sp.]|nr:DUF4230 domain-containing protein [Olegusella sp.]MEE1273477.1 DUF4230 domain-containing protein [Olegusella sp.]
MAKIRIRPQFARPMVTLTFVAAVLVVLFIVVPMITSAVGSSAGIAVGTATGTADTFAEAKDTVSDAKTDALSAEDTEVLLGNAITNVGNLDVLTAGVVIENINKVGKSYEGLYLVKGDAVFSVDLTKADVSLGENENGEQVLTVTLPEPTVKLYLDEDKTELLAEEQHFDLFSGAEEGIQEYLNSMANITEKSEKSIMGYDDLMENARTTAIAQVEDLTSMACGDSYQVVVQFEGEGE